MECDRTLTKGTFLAVRSNDGFYLCRLEETSTLEPEKNYSITWLEETKLRGNYILSFKEKICAENIICSVKMEKISRFRFKLPQKGRQFIEAELKYALEECNEYTAETHNKLSNFSPSRADLNKNTTRCPNDEKYGVVIDDEGRPGMDNTPRALGNIEESNSSVRNTLTDEKEGNCSGQFKENQIKSSYRYEKQNVSGSTHSEEPTEPIMANNFQKEINTKEEHGDFFRTIDETGEDNISDKCLSTQVTDHNLEYLGNSNKDNDEQFHKVNILQTEKHDSDEWISSAEEIFEDSGSDYSPESVYKRKIFSKKAQNKLKINKSITNEKRVKKETVSSTKNPNKKIIILENKIVKPANLSTNSKSSLPASVTSHKFNDSDSTMSSDNENLDYVTVSKARKNNNKRIYDKRHSCFICHKMCLKMSRHLELKHKDDTNVARVLAMEIHSAERRAGFQYLIRAGDFYHNMEVLARKEGELVLCRRPSEKEWKSYPFHKFGPCPYCLGFLLKKQLWSHAKKCSRVKRDEKDTALKSSIQMESNSIISSILHSDLNDKFRKYILDPLQSDEISYVCKTDKVILGVGAMSFEKHGSSQNDLIRQTMRQLARLLIELRHSQEEFRLKDLRFFINPLHFDKIIIAVKSLCKTKTSDLQRSEYSIPSLALKLGHSLRKCVGYLRGQSLRVGDINGDATLKSFLELLDLEWSTRISSSALATIEMRKMNTAKLLPTTSDLLKLNNFLSKEISVFMVLLQKNPTEKEAWLRLAEATLARVILFNKRRSGEASRMTLSQYATCPNWVAESTEELQNTLSSFEKEIAAKMRLIQIRGKRGRTVPVLLTNEMVSAINLLISTRYTVGVSGENVFVFARPNNDSLSYIRGPDALRIIVQKAKVECPDLITSTKLRKYIATVSQIFSLRDNELDWLARHLGHDIRVHRDFYRLHESAIELTKVSRLLMTVDEGKVAQFSGKALSDINLNELPEIEEDELQDVEENCESEDENDLSSHTTELASKGKEKGSQNLLPNGPKPDAVIMKSRKAQRTTWNSQEIKAVTKFFRSQIKNKIVPGKKLCDECIEKNRVALQRRGWRDIKYYVKNYIDRIRKYEKNN